MNQLLAAGFLEVKTGGFFSPGSSFLSSFLGTGSNHFFIASLQKPSSLGSSRFIASLLGPSSLMSLAAFADQFQPKSSSSSFFPLNLGGPSFDSSSFCFEISPHLNSPLPHPSAEFSSTFTSSFPYSIFSLNFCSSLYFNFCYHSI